MQDGYTTIREEATAEHVEKRSRFLSLAVPVSDEHTAVSILNDLRAKYWDATHNCYAYILRAGGIQRYSDDGEPQGTAGMPILEVLRRRELTDTMVVVTRYFGGTLLGAGGLVRAYTLGTTLALDAAQLVEMRPCTVISVSFPYPLYGKLQNLLPQWRAQTLEEVFEEDVSLTLRLETSQLSALEKELLELSAGQIRPIILREEYAPMEGN